MATSAEGQPEAEPVANAPAVIPGADNDVPTTSPEKQDTTADPAPANITRSVEMTDAPPVEESKQPTSQPMTASSSTSSIVQSKDAPPSAPAPVYGTRSRNRGGASRVNYAEDKELDMEIEAQAIPKEENPRKRKGASETHSRSNTVEPPAAIAPVKRAAALQADTNGASQEPQKEKTQIPGTLTFSANPSATAPSQPAKKRKMNKSDNSANGINGTHLTPTKPGTPVPRINQSTGKESAMLSFDNCGARLKDGKLFADDGTVLAVNDHVYLVCEPPGEPYYLGRIMEFLHVDNDVKKAVDALRMNWYYRPRDIQRKVVDTRQIFASMHSDISPLTSLRGICTIKHKSEIEDMDEYRRQQNCFWYEKLFDRYIHRYYEVVPTTQVVNVPKSVKKVLDERWKYIIVETGRAKELTSASKSCKRCSGFCTNATSVDCAVCHRTYHMKCVRPPLLKKPTRGFGWQCGPCSRALSRKFEASKNAAHAGEEGEELEEEDEYHEVEEGETGATTPLGEVDTMIVPGTPEQIYQASLWPFRYLGIHCKVEDCLDYDDRIYPRAISRLGPKYQADVLPWAGRPVQLVPRLDIKRRFTKGGNKKEGKLSKESLAAIEADKIAKESRPKWVEDEPVGYVARGEDYDNDDPRCTATLLFKPLESENQDQLVRRDSIINDYVEQTAPIARAIGVATYSTNFLTTAITLLHAADYEVDRALSQLSKVTKTDLKEPQLSPPELKKFEEAVAKFGSELLSVKRHVKTVSAANIVRFYYVWKKSERGKQIWGNYSGRKGKKEAKKVSTGKLQDDVADDQDDSAFDNDKAIAKKKGFQCKFCSTRSSRQWRRAPNTPPGTTVNVDSNGKVSNKEKGTTPVMVALCLNCAIVWRRYAVQWEDSDDHKKLGGAAKYKRKAADDPLREFQLSELSWTASNTEAANTPSGTPAPETAPPPVVQDAPPRKKLKLNLEKSKEPKQPEPKPEPEVPVATPEPPPPAPVVVKKKPVEKPLPPPPPPPPPEPVMPPPKVLPCSVCEQMEPMDQHVSCKECRMTVHRSCYGISTIRAADKWTCDTCTNDRAPAAFCGYYKCVLCPVECTPQDFVEPAKISHKKKTEKEREKDRQDRELAVKAAEFYRKKQEDAGRPVDPREPLKRTQNNKWAHVTCAIWTPEIRFGNAKELQPVEGVTMIPRTKHAEICKVCKGTEGCCINCHSCKAPMHVECAHQAGYLLGFDITPVKGSKRDHSNVVTIGAETGIMTAAVWCKEHIPTKTIVHHIQDVVDEESGKTALQLYAEKYKQADLTQTGALRKSSAVTVVPAADALASAPITIVTSNRRSSTIAASNAVKAAAAAKAEEQASGSPPKEELGGPCAKCHAETTPRWYPLRAMVNGGISGHGRITPPEQDGPKQVALAAAALNEGSADEVLCHRCFKNSLKAKPEPPPSPSRVMDIPVQTAAPRPPAAMQPVPLEPTPMIDPSPVPATLPALNQHAPPPPIHPQPHTPSWLSHPPPYSPSAAYAGWGGGDRRGSATHLTNGTYLPHHSPRQALPNGPPAMESTPRGMNSVLHAPHLGNGSPHINRQPPLNPYQSGSPHPPPHVYRAPSPYRAGSPYRPGSPPREMRQHMPPMHHQQHQPQSLYPSYAGSRPLPQHLTNGGPPPRPQEASYTPRPQEQSYQQRALHDEQMRIRERTQHYYRSAMPYPEVGREREERDPREMRERDNREREVREREREREQREGNGYSQQVNGVLPAHQMPPRAPQPAQPQPQPPQSGTDHRVNGGASASPSLRNLLS